MFKKFLLISLLFLSSCAISQRSFKEIINDPFNLKAEGKNATNAPLTLENSVVICRSKQCAPAKLSMSKEYIYNSLLQLFDNNDNSRALVCQSNPASKSCLETYITLPITVGITPAYMYIDYVKISDVSFTEDTSQITALLNYHVTYNGQTPVCNPSKTIIFAKNAEHVLLEDSGYSCKMTTVGKTSVKTVFAIDYIDLDYGFIGGYYSIGLSGPAYGGGTGYMLLKLQKNAYPLSPALQTPKNSQNKDIAREQNINRTSNSQSTAGVDGVQIFPINK